GLRDIPSTAGLMSSRDFGVFSIANELRQIAQVVRVTRAPENDLRSGRVPDRLRLFTPPTIARLRQRLQDRDRRDARTAALTHQGTQRGQRVVRRFVENHRRRRIEAGAGRRAGELPRGLHHVLDQGGDDVRRGERARARAEEVERAVLFKKLRGLKLSAGLWSELLYDLGTREGRED